jgi:hypothetical protein
MRPMNETRRFCWALAAAVLSLSILAAMATSVEQRTDRTLPGNPTHAVSGSAPVAG